MPLTRPGTEQEGEGLHLGMQRRIAHTCRADLGEGAGQRSAGDGALEEGDVVVDLGPGAGADDDAGDGRVTQGELQGGGLEGVSYSAQVAARAWARATSGGGAAT